MRKLYLGLSLFALATLGFALGRPVQVLPRAQPSPTFTLTDQLGRSFSEADLRGRIAVFNFIYTRCTTACPTMTGQMRLLRERLLAEGLLGGSVVLVSLSFDPEHDTPQVLREYAARFGADPDTWRFLTGDAATLKEVIGGGFGLYYEKTPSSGEHGQGGYEFVHANRFVVVDERGVIRAEYRDLTLDVERVVRDIRLVSREAASAGAERIVYEAAHLFMCYPW
jgi:protein SCO1/2